MVENQYVEHFVNYLLYIKFTFVLILYKVILISENMEVTSNGEFILFYKTFNFLQFNHLCIYILVLYLYIILLKDKYVCKCIHVCMDHKYPRCILHL